ncbi:MAG: NUDIX hydrolase [Chloroflexota bacterium]
MKTWTTLGRRVLLNLGWRLKVELHRVELHDGRIIDDWSWVVTPPYANVIAITEDGLFVAFRQTKYSVGHTLAPVGGHIEAGEDPLAAAKRELLEETGYAAPDENWTYLGQYAVDANRGCGTAYLYLATGATFAGVVESDDLEEQELILMSRDEVNTALAQAQFRVLPWAAAFALALLYVDGTLPTD